MTKDKKPTEVDNGKRRKIVLPPKHSSPIIETSIIPATDILLHDARCILASELARYRAKTSKGVSLDLKEARVVQGYLETLIRLQKEEREEARSQDLSNLSNEELLDLAAKVLGSERPKLVEKASESTDDDR